MCLSLIGRHNLMSTRYGMVVLVSGSHISDSQIVRCGVDRADNAVGVVLPM